MGADEGGLRAASEFRLLNEPKRPGSIREWPGAPWLAVGAVCVGAFMGQLDASIVTLALPSLQRSFDASLGAVTWVALSYLLVLVALVTAFGRVSDMAGRKLIYLYGFVVFTIGSALCGLAPTLLALDGARVIQAVGAAMLQANSVAIIVLAVPPRSIGKAVGFQGAAQAIGIAMGPTVGGLLVAAGGWRLIFFVNVPFGVIGLIAGWLFIPRSRNLSACSSPPSCSCSSGSPLGTRRAGSRPRSWLPWLLARPCSVASSSKSAVPTRRCSTSASSDARRSLSASRADSCPRWCSSACSSSSRSTSSARSGSARAAPGSS
jgi:MFS family permease